MAGQDQACGRILVVDDDPGLRTLVAETLRDAGYAITEAGDAKSALAGIARQPAQLAIVDVNLPGLSGYELYRRLRSESRGLPVIFISGERTESFDRVAGLMLGADDYMAKPFAPDELVARVASLLRRSVQPAANGHRSKLTKRELQVLTLLADGRNQREIATTLVISPKTVGTHIEHILEKLNVRSRAQAVALAYRDDLLGSQPPE